MPGTAHTFDLDDSPEQRAYVDLVMDVDHDQAQEGRARRNATTTARLLGAVASALAIYDLILLVRAVGH